MERDRIRGEMGQETGAAVRPLAASTSTPAPVLARCRCSQKLIRPLDGFRESDNGSDHAVPGGAASRSGASRVAAVHGLDHRLRGGPRTRRRPVSRPAPARRTAPPPRSRPAGPAASNSPDIGESKTSSGQEPGYRLCKARWALPPHLSSRRRPYATQSRPNRRPCSNFGPGRSRVRTPHAVRGPGARRAVRPAGACRVGLRWVSCHSGSTTGFPGGLWCGGAGDVQRDMPQKMSK